MTLKQLREQSGLTAKEVAEELGVTLRAIYNYEGGARELPLLSVLKLAKLYDCTEKEVIEAALKVQSLRDILYRTEGRP